MGNQMCIVVMLSLAIILSGVGIVVLEKRRRRKLLERFDEVKTGDLYSLTYLSQYYPREEVVDRVVIVGKFVSPGGEPWISYEYENEQTPYDVPFEDFIERFVEIENNPTSH